MEAIDVGRRTLFAIGLGLAGCDAQASEQYQGEPLRLFPADFNVSLYQSPGDDALKPQFDGEPRMGRSAKPQLVTSAAPRLTCVRTRWCESSLPTIP